MDGQFYAENPFIGRRDLFYPESRQGKEKVAFVRHDFWVSKLNSFGLRLYTSVDAMLYGRAFKSTA